LDANPAPDSGLFTFLEGFLEPVAPGAAGVAGFFLSDPASFRILCTRLSQSRSIRQASGKLSRPPISVIHLHKNCPDLVDLLHTPAMKTPSDCPINPISADSSLLRTAFTLAYEESNLCTYYMLTEVF